MRDNHIEDIGVSGGQAGPVIEQYFGVKKFVVDFSNGGIEWVTNPLKTVTGKSVGEDNINLLHKRLDEFLIRYIKENRNE